MNFEALTAEDMAIIAEEEAMAEQSVMAILQHSGLKSAGLSQIEALVWELRDQARYAQDTDLAAILDQMNAAKALLDRKPPASLPNINAPYFARMTLEEDGQIKHILIGHQAFLEGHWPIIDWRNAPLSRIFYRYREGDAYEEKLPKRVARGIVRTKNLLTFKDRKLTSIMTDRKTFRRTNEGWMIDPQGFRPQLAGGEGSATRVLATRRITGEIRSSELSALLDPQQFEILESAQKDNILILGSAGSGKTTIASHRLAMLNYNDPKRYSTSEMAVLVPEEGLMRLFSRLLEGFGLGAVLASTYDQWLMRQVVRWFQKTPTKIYGDSPYVSLKIKRHPKMWEICQTYCHNLKLEFAKKLQSKFEHHQTILDVLRPSEHLPYRDYLERARQIHLESTKVKARQNVIRKFYEKLTQESLDFNVHKGALILKSGYLEQLMGLSHGVITNSDIENLREYTRQQLGFGVSEDFDGVDEERLLALDGGNIAKERTEDPLFESVDPEDYTLLSILLQTMSGGLLQPGKSYRHLVVDEVQDFSPLELQVMGYLLNSKASDSSDNSSVTLAGDEAQIIDPSSYFVNWHDHAANLGKTALNVHALLKSYRSTEEINLFAHKILGDEAPSHPPHSQRKGPPVMAQVFAAEGSAMMVLAEVLTELVLNEPLATVAVICKDQTRALMVFDAIKDVPKLRLVVGGEFIFMSGIDVTTVSNVKGLEFDYVIIPDATAQAYPDTKSSRRFLHIAASRAIHQLWILAAVQLTPIVHFLVGERDDSKVPLA